MFWCRARASGRQCAWRRQQAGRPTRLRPRQRSLLAAIAAGSQPTHVWRRSCWGVSGGPPCWRLMADARIDSSWHISIQSTATEHVEQGKDFITYEVVVHVGRTQWTVSRRYSAFLGLKNHIQSRFNIKRLPSFPRKQPLGRGSAAIVQKRRAALENFMSAACAVPGVTDDLHFLEFLDAPDEVRGGTPASK